MLLCSSSDLCLGVFLLLFWLLSQGNGQTLTSVVEVNLRRGWMKMYKYKVCKRLSVKWQSFKSIERDKDIINL